MRQNICLKLQFVKALKLYLCIMVVGPYDGGPGHSDTFRISTLHNRRQHNMIGLLLTPLELYTYLNSAMNNSTSSRSTSLGHPFNFTTQIKIEEGFDKDWEFYDSCPWTATN